MAPQRHTGPDPEADRPDYAGRYVLESRLGSGGMGVVHLATSASGMRLAVKVVHGDYASDPEFRARFRQEVAAARTVSGAFTAPVVDADPEAQRPWMATLFIEGPTLSERVKRQGPLDAGELVMLGAGLAEGLRDIHRAGVVHRDLKPSNVLLAADGPKVIDFGISRPKNSDLRTETGKLIGTPPFMAPEQFERPRDVGPAADVFALGALLVHAATGRGPFDSDSPYVVAYRVVHNEPDLAGVPESLLPLIRHCLAKDPVERPTPDELMAALRPASSTTRGRGPDPQLPAGTDFATTTAVSSGRKRRWPLWVAGVTCLTALTVAGIVGVHARTTTDRPSVAPALAQRGQEFSPWHTLLRRDGGENRTPVCSVSSPDVYCTAPGITAARVNLTDGHITWVVPSALGTGDADESTEPLISADVLFVVAPGSNQLEAIDRASGKKLWGVDFSPYNTLFHVGGSVVLATSDGLLRSLSATNGAELWTTPGGQGHGALWAAAHGGAGPLFAVTTSDTGNTTVRAIDPRQGTPLWVNQVPGVLTPVDVSDGALFLLSHNAVDAADAVVRLDTQDRTVRRVPLPAPVEQAQATVAGDSVYLVGYTGSLLALDTGEAGTSPAGQRWRLETSVTRSSRPTVVGDRVYLSAGDGRLLAVDGRRGVLLGQTKPRMDAGRFTLTGLLPAPVALPGEVVATAPDGSVFAVDSRDPSRW